MKLTNNKKEYDKNRRKLYPWKMLLNDINKRCNNPKCKSYKNYGKRGIKNFLIEEDIKFLMKRDKYKLMKQPSIDRKDNDGNYTLENCEFIEKSLNSQKDKEISILQFDLNGNFIREFESITKAIRNTNWSTSNLCQVAKSKRKSAYNFLWKYKNDSSI